MKPMSTHPKIIKGSNEITSDLDQTKIFSINPDFLGALWCDLDQTKIFSINPDFLGAL